MKKNLLLVLVILIGLSSCSNDSDFNNPDQNPKNKTINVPEANLTVVIKDNRLSFENQSAFEAAIEALNQYDINEFRAANNTGEPVFDTNFSLKKYDFQSLYDDFSDAMNEAEKYYDTEEGYKEFKKKHPALFFAEQPEDYSAYLPVSDMTVAKLLNPKGEVEIAGEVKDLRDITSYEQLVDIGLTPKPEELKSTKSPVNSLKEVRCNNRKLWVKAWVRPSKQPGASWDKIVEVSFRKKGFLGAWYNYWSETELGWVNNPVKLPPKSGWSSHDYMWVAGKLGGFKGTMWLKFRGFGSECGDQKYEFDVDL